MNDFVLFYAFSLGQVCRLTKELQSSEKKFRDTKNTLIQQAAKKEAEYQQTITNLNKSNTENVKKLTEERVNNLLFEKNRIRQ